jgi:uncharacterized protein YcsI (UPF0317 family)
MPRKPPADLAAHREAERLAKARQRATKRADGYVQVSVWVSPDYVDDVLSYASTLPSPAPKIDRNPGQMNLFGGE